MSTEKPTAGTIEARQTPNPNARKFVLAGVRFGPSRNYALGGPVGNGLGDSVEDALATRLLQLEGVYNVLLAQDFVTVNKLPHVEWPPLQAAVEAVLVDFVTQSVNHVD